MMRKGGCYSWELAPVLAEMERLEMESLLHGCDDDMAEFAKHMREMRSKDPDCEKAETG